jgi:type I restriction enzyme M protein
VLDCPSGTFQGAGVKTVVLFFQKGEATRRVWYYQQQPDRPFGKTNPLKDEHLADFVARQTDLAEGPNSWTVDAGSLDPATFDLTVRNPDAPEAAALRSPTEILDEIARLDSESAVVLARVRELL